MGSFTSNPKIPKLWIETPCIPSAPLSRAAGCNIFLKLENLQPSGSFKSRGVGTMMQRAMLSLNNKTSTEDDSKAAAAVPHFYCSSGGNAGLACATAAITLGAPCTIVVPQTTPDAMVTKLRDLGAEVDQVGRGWAEADEHLRDGLLARDPAGVYVPPFEHPDIWEGASTMVDELQRQMSELIQLPAGQPPDAIVCNCGGGGLANGIMEGVERMTTGGDTEPPLWTKPPQVLVVETQGAESLDASVRAGRLVTLPAITSIATSLGARTVSPRTLRWSQEAAHMSNVVVSDADAVEGAVRFADDARFLVEVACGASLSVVYNGVLRQTVGRGVDDEGWRRMNVVVVVCGGSHVSLEVLGGYWEKYCGGDDGVS